MTRTPMTRMKQRRRDEQGIALLVALLVMVVCTILVGATLAIAEHSAQRSGLNRDHSAALHAAEAGIEAEIATLSDGSCPTVAGAETALPDPSLVKASYKILVPSSCTTGGNAVVAAVGYAPNATKPVATATIVAHMNRGQGASASTGNNGGYVFPDALFSTGTLSTNAGKQLSVFGVGGTVPSIAANGAINIADSAGQLDGPVRGWSSVNVSGAQIGGTVVGTDVTLSNAPVQGDVTATNNLNLSSTTVVNGNVAYGGVNSSTSPIVTGTGPIQHATTLPAQRPAPVFTDNCAGISPCTNSDIGTLLGVGSTPTQSCPTSGTGNFYDYTSTSACAYNPLTINGTVVVIAHGGTVNVSVPQTSIGQLYVINDAGGISITGANSTMPVFAWASGAVTLSGAFVGQVAGGTITVTADTTMTFFPPAIPVPDFAFPGGYSTPTLGYAATVAFEYQCPRPTAC